MGESPVSPVFHLLGPFDAPYAYAYQTYLCFLLCIVFFCEDLCVKEFAVVTDKGNSSFSFVEEEQCGRLCVT